MSTKGIALLVAMCAFPAVPRLEAQLHGVPYISPGRPNPRGRGAFYILFGGASYDNADRMFSTAIFLDYLLLPRLPLGAGAACAVFRFRDSGSGTVLIARFA